MIDFFQKIPKWLRLLFLFPLLVLNGALLAFLLDYLQPLVDFVIVANLFAFLLNLLINFLETKGVRKKVAIPLILLSTIVFLLLFSVLLIPTMIEQFSQFVVNVPQWIKSTDEQLKNFTTSPLAAKLPIDLKDLTSQATTKLSQNFKALGTQGLALVLATFSNLFNGIIVFVLTVFFLVSGQSFWDGILKWLPFPWNLKIKEYTRNTFKEYFVARLFLAIASSVARLIAFWLIGVPYDILFAFGIGLIGLIPFVAGIVVLIAGLLLCLKNVTMGLLFLASAIVIDQITENVLAPKFMGDKIGLHPIWIFISIFLGAKLGGLLGVLLAVPIASVMKQIAEDLQGHGKQPENLAESFPLQELDQTT